MAEGDDAHEREARRRQRNVGRGVEGGRKRRWSGGLPREIFCGCPVAEWHLDRTFSGKRLFILFYFILNKHSTCTLCTYEQQVYGYLIYQ